MSAHGHASILAPHPPLADYYADSSVKPGFLKGIFDTTAKDYDFVERLLSWGTGSWYRRQALRRAGLTTGMTLLDVAVGTGLVAREGVTIVGDPKLVLGLDPSLGMVSQAAGALRIRTILGVAEQLPFTSGKFCFLSMGYALRHLSDVHRTFEEFYRVLRPGGRLCLLEITAPRQPLGRALLRAYMRRLVPILTRVATGREQSQTLWQYYWDTIDACIQPETLLAALDAAGFEHTSRHVELGIFSEYTARKPD